MSVSRRANIRATCYVVDAVTTSLSGIQYTTTGAGGTSNTPRTFDTCKRSLY